MNDEIKSIDMYFRLANYITICQMYLKSNLLLERKMMPEDIKEVNSGHWGVTPALNFVYAHLNNFIKKHNIKTQFIIGTGHAGAPLLSNQFIDGTLSKYYKEITWDYNGFCKLVNLFGTEKGFRSEINPQMPKTIYEGGELGYALAFSYGVSLDNENTFIPCFIGDGEAETGTTASSWQLVRFLNNKCTGKVLPILNLNGKKMGSDSIFSTYSDKELTKFFSAIGYEVCIVHNNHAEMIDALEKTYNNDTNYIIILKTPKGWTAPEHNGFKIEGELYSHKNPLHVLNDKEKMADYIETWLKSYGIEELMTLKSGINEKIKKLSCNELYITPNSHATLNLPSIDKYFVKTKSYKNVSILSNYVAEIVKNNFNFRVFSPDELVSNSFNSVYEITHNNLTKGNKEGKISEILNENICQAMMQGYIMNGKYALFVGYEAFMPIITSQISQQLKFMYESRKAKWSNIITSFNYILTSTCYENNYSHQNPEFINSMLNKNYDFTNVYMPADANSCLMYYEKMIKSSNQINALISSKGLNKQYLSFEESKELVSNGMVLLGDKIKNPDVILACSGDYVFDETIETYKLLKEILPYIKVNIVYVGEIKKLAKGYSGSYSDEEYYRYFDKYVYCVYMFHGYESVIKNLIYERDGKYQVIGYKDKSDIAGTRLQKMKLNGLYRENVVNDICLKLLENGKIVLNLDFIKLFKEVNNVSAKQLSFLE